MILVVGANGQLGSELKRILQNGAVYVDHNDLDIADAAAVETFFKNNKISTIINCAAYTNVDKAEENAADAERVNVFGVRNLAKTGVPMVHISTDYVFDGQGNRPYQETDPTNPQSVYGKSKREGEEVLWENCKESIIIRTAWLYSSFGNNFVKTMIRLGKERDSLNVVADQTGTPTYAADLAKAIMDIIVFDTEKQLFPAGIYHYSNEGICSWYDFTLKIHELAGITSCQVNPITTDQYPTKAKRPMYSVLDKTKIKETFKLEIPEWEGSLSKCMFNSDKI